MDATGAIGIARAFAYGGNHNRAIYILDCQPEINVTETEHRNVMMNRMNNKKGYHV